MPIHKKSVRRTYWADLQSTIEPLKGGGALVNVLVSVPGLGLLLNVSADLSDGDLAVHPPFTDEHLVTFSQQSIRSAIDLALSPTPKGATGDTTLQSIDEFGAEYLELKKKYNRLLCSHLGILHD